MLRRARHCCSSAGYLQEREEKTQRWGQRPTGDYCVGEKRQEAVVEMPDSRLIDVGCFLMNGFHPGRRWEMATEGGQLNFTGGPSGVTGASLRSELLNISAASLTGCQPFCCWCGGVSWIGPFFLLPGDRVLNLALQRIHALASPSRLPDLADHAPDGRRHHHSLEPKVG